VQARETLESGEGIRGTAANVPRIFAPRGGSLFPVVDGDTLAIVKLKAPKDGGFVAIALMRLTQEHAQGLVGGANGTLKGSAAAITLAKYCEGGKVGNDGHDWKGGEALASLKQQ
jgi:hypothetical protein